MQSEELLVVDGPGEPEVCRKPVNIYIDVRVRDLARDLARAQNRSFSNYVESLLIREANAGGSSFQAAARPSWTT